ncbi:MAG TPA: D-alanyl-D-alanine carboxypeptidase [Solirubrobacteraceae bacterium]|nr:D-alanyl-D-alanine carboxypeptidase [Solirubrobacteraceae bacterium]
MSRKLTVPAVALAAALLAPSAAHGQSLTQELARLTRSGSVAVHVADAQSGRTLYARRAGVKRPLASTAKLLTTLAALQTLGGRTAHLRTTVLATGPIDTAGTVHGNLILHGDGDPTFGTSQAFTLADKVYAAGVRRVTGAVIADESLFDTVRGGPSTGGGFDPELEAPLSALSYDLGQQTPGGAVSADPLPLAAAKFDDKLEAKGIVLPNRPGTTTTPIAGGTEIAAVPSPTMAKLLSTMLALSDDFFAEMLTKRIAAAAGQLPGSTAAGARLIQRPGTTLVDGSGLDRRDTGTAKALTSTLRALRKAGGDILLTRAGTGTLRGRLTGTKCRAKTGTLSGVANLAGLCTTSRGRKVAFAVFGSSKPQVDRIARAIARRG